MTWIIKLKGEKIGELDSDKADDSIDACLNWADENLEATEVKQ